MGATSPIYSNVKTLELHPDIIFSKPIFLCGRPSFCLCHIFWNLNTRLHSRTIRLHSRTINSSHRGQLLVAVMFPFHKNRFLFVLISTLFVCQHKFEFEFG